ncbi:Rieske 2Fe-2S domain-containing protein [Mycobacterium sp.]|uniref:Rieske 2Fe-2S domain-containing protein n=1 Tax=Mycobacterium sp. TaxID=1785 RepID=UPI003C7415F4
MTVEDCHEVPPTEATTDVVGTSPGWWTVAHSEELYDKPVATRLGAYELVAFRDAGGIPRVLLDVCPHRRVPLSLGRVNEHGALQCGYHGWCFDGASGQLTKIPNYRAGQRLPPRVKVGSWPTEERYGLVQVWTGPDEPGAPVSVKAAIACARATGTAELPISHSDCVSRLLSDPVALIFGVAIQPRGAEKLETTTSVRLTRRIARAHGALGRVLFGPKGTEFDLTSETSATTGLTEISVVALDEVTVLQLVVAPTPIAGDRTELRWRAMCRGDMLVRTRNNALKALTTKAASATSRRCKTAAGTATSEAAFGAWRGLGATSSPALPAVPELASTNAE